MSGLDLSRDPVGLTEALVDIASVSGDEREIADQVEAALLSLSFLDISRNGDAVVARTHLGRDTRVVLAGHLDTVPIANNVPSRREGGALYGCGTSDMKSGDAVMLYLAAQLAERRSWCDLTFVFYDHEEVAAEASGLLR